jgi:hypothetical protein
MRSDATARRWQSARPAKDPSRHGAPPAARPRQAIDSQPVLPHAGHPRPPPRSHDGQTILKSAKPDPESYPDLLIRGGRSWFRTCDPSLVSNSGTVQRASSSCGTCVQRAATILPQGRPGTAAAATASLGRPVPSTSGTAGARAGTTRRRSPSLPLPRCRAAACAGSRPRRRQPARQLIRGWCTGRLPRSPRRDALSSFPRAPNARGLRRGGGRRRALGRAAAAGTSRSAGRPGADN